MTEALYARVSSDDQTVDTQLEALRSRAPGAAEFVDVAKSGRADDRPQFEALLAAMRGGQVTSVYVTKLDRLGRSAKTILEFFELAERYRAATDPKVVARLGDELGRMVFGD